MKHSLCFQLNNSSKNLCVHIEKSAVSHGLIGEIIQQYPWALPHLLQSDSYEANKTRAKKAYYSQLVIFPLISDQRIFLLGTPYSRKILA